MISEDEDYSAEESPIIPRQKKTLPVDSDEDELESFSSCGEEEENQENSSKKNSSLEDERLQNSNLRESLGSIKGNSRQSNSGIIPNSELFQTSHEDEPFRISNQRESLGSAVGSSQQSNSGIIASSPHNETLSKSLKTSTPSNKVKKRGKSYFADKYDDSNRLSSDVILIEETSSSNEEQKMKDKGSINKIRGKSFSTSRQTKKPSSDSDEDSMIAFTKKTSTRIIDSDKDVNKIRGKSFSTPQQTKKHSSDSDEESMILLTKKKTMKILDSDEDEASFRSSASHNDEIPKRSKKSFITPRKIKSYSSSDSDEASESIVISDDGESDVIEPSWTDESPETTTRKTPNIRPKTLNQPTLEGIVKKMTLANDEKTKNGKIECKRTDYKRQIELIQKYEQEMGKTKNLLTTIKLANLPDKGKLLRERFEEFKKNFLDAQEKLKNMVVTEEDLPQPPVTGRAALTENWNNLEAGMAVVQPKTFGKKGLQQHNIQRALTADCLEQLHGSLKNCPNDENLENDPGGLKIPLMHHQKRALKWLLYREKQKPSGGILADDMGLGKTLTMISLIVRALEESETDDDSESMSRNKYKGRTLVVCPASLLYQWGQEIETKLKRGTLSYYIYHGPKRESKPKRLAENDVVITTYSIVMNESEKNGAIFRIRWKRIILDEAHQIRNHKAQTSIACCSLSGVSRWALTGTPVHNKELDMYALLKFLRCSPFDDLAVWKRWVGDKTSGGGERLHTVISSLMLRRTKAELIQQGKLATLPSKEWQMNLVTLDESEMNLYHKVLIFSQKLFAQFLHQRAEKNQDYMDLKNPNAPVNNEYLKMRQKLLKLNRLKEISQHEILVLLLRLRQICCHPSLIIGMLQGDEDLGDEEPETKEELNLLQQLEKLDLEDHVTDGDAENAANRSGLDFGGDAGVAFKEAARNILSPSHPIFARDRMSSKIKAVMHLVPKILAANDKIVMVSQWKSYLELIGIHLKESGIKFLQFDGSVVTAKRNEMTAAFNDVNSKVKVLLLSLTAGGVGLNLIGGNHLFLLDLHWNPQLESQAQDRIYRMGQKKDVHVYKFMTSDTIEERILKLQENKLAIAENMISGTKQVIANKLSLQDLKMLFNM